MGFVKLGIALFLFILLVSIVDILFDFSSREVSIYHVWTEFGVVVVSLLGLAALIRFVHQQHMLLQGVKNELTNTQATLNESRHQVKKHMESLSIAIQNQFNEWNLTPSEKDIALLLLKGLTLDEAATVRETKEKTVRQQACSIYKKAGVSGRHGLVAYFFEDLLVG